jgi:hypothetical protein
VTTLLISEPEHGVKQERQQDELHHDRRQILLALAVIAFE